MHWHADTHSDVKLSLHVRFLVLLLCRLSHYFLTVPGLAVLRLGVVSATVRVATELREVEKYV
jgi:hypothetical protein